MRSLLTLSVLSVLAVSACDKSQPTGSQPEPTAAPPAPSASVAEEVPALPSAPAAPDPVCTVVEQKVWGKWANQRTGITPRKLDGQLAVGVAFGNRPHVLVFDGDGKGKLVKIEPHAGSALLAELKEPQGRRDLQRVTPVVVNGQLTAYADYRDKYNDNKRRRIACELVSENKPVLVFDDAPVLSRPGATAAAAGATAAATAAVAPEAAAEAPKRKGRLKFSRRADAADGGAAATAEPEAPAATAAVAPAAPEPTAPAAKVEPIREIRDCRTFVDGDGSVWGVGSELYGEHKDDAIKWSMRIFAAPSAGAGYVMLDAHPLPKSPRDPQDLHTLEAPVAQELGGGEHAIFGRYRGALHGFLLDKSFRSRGGRKTYTGGHPGLARFFHEGGQRHVLVSQKTGEDQWRLSAGTLDGAVPKALTTIKLDQGNALSEPSLALAGKTRWLAYHSGPRRSAQIEVVPVDASFAPIGRPHPVTAGEEVYESLVYALPDGRLLVTYIGSIDKTAVLASQVLSCSVKT